MIGSILLKSNFDLIFGVVLLLLVVFIVLGDDNSKFLEATLQNYKIQER